MSASPAVCVSLGESNPKRLLHRLKEVEQTYADLVEIRTDFLRQPTVSHVSACLKQVELPVILTCRSVEEGGRFHGSQGARLRFLRELAALGPDYLDVELATLQRNAELASTLAENGCKLIASIHFVQKPGTLSSLEAVAQDAIEIAQLGKIIPFAATIDDNLKILSLYRARFAGRLIAFCLGRLGFLSRALCPLFGSPFTYAGLSENGTAEGQPSLARLRRFYEELDL